MIHLLLYLGDYMELKKFFYILSGYLLFINLTVLMGADSESTHKPFLSQYSSGVMVNYTGERESKNADFTRMIRNVSAYMSTPKGLQGTRDAVYALFHSGHHKQCPSQDPKVKCVSEIVHGIVGDSSLTLRERQAVEKLIKVERGYTLCKQPCVRLPFHAFYHSHSAAARVLYGCWRQIMEFQRQVPLKNFIPVRSMQDPTIPGVSDSTKYAREILGGAQDAGLPAEYMVADIAPSIQPSECYAKTDAVLSGLYSDILEKRLKEVFAAYDFDPKHIENLVKLNQLGMYRSGAMFQILIPENFVKQSVCLIRKDGKSYNSDTRNVASTLQGIQSGAFMRRHHMYAEQAIPRVVIHVAHDGMLNPESGIQVRASSADISTHSDFFLDDLSSIMREVFINFLKRRSDQLGHNGLGMGKIKPSALARLQGDSIGDILGDRSKVDALKIKLEKDNVRAAPRARL